MPFAESPRAAKGSPLIASEPRRKNDKPSDAIYEFLNGWLVQQKPNESIAYFSDEAFACMEAVKARIDRGMAKYTLLQGMIAVNKRIGKASSLSEVTVGVPLSSDRLKLMEHPHQSQFVLYDVREDLAEAFFGARRTTTGG
ncbi:MAG TPA: hypothetical protein VEX68_24955 [Bryobacteraceae bacterium]|nr:hypothetical protein [Bryobacteraceae bacterium]